MGEIWKPIPVTTFDKCYEVSSLGRVRRVLQFGPLSRAQVEDVLQCLAQGMSVNSVRHLFHVSSDTIHKVRDEGQYPYRLMQLHTTKGYPRVNLSADGKARKFFVAFLVLTAFAGPAPTDMTVNHKNGIRDDNRLENLEWLTMADNNRHSWHVLGRNPVPGQKGSANHKAKLTETDIPFIRSWHTSGMCAVHIASAYGVERSTIDCIIHRKSWAHVP